MTFVVENPIISLPDNGYTGGYNGKYRINRRNKVDRSWSIPVEGRFMAKKGVGIILVVVGVLVVILGLGAELLGVGGKDTIGWVQILFAGMGVVMVIGGWDILRDTRAG